MYSGVSPAVRRRYFKASAPHDVCMRTRVDVPTHLLALAASQGGVLTTAQLNQLPMETFRRVRADWHRLSRGLWCLTDPTWSSAAWAGLLRAGRDSALGGAAALHVWGLQQSAPNAIMIWVPTTSTPRLVVHDWTIQFRRGHRRGMGTPSRTNVEDAVLDSAAGLDEDSFVAITSRALSERRTTPARLLAALSFRERLRYRCVIEELCGVAGKGVESVLEWRYAERVERRHQLPALERQARLDVRARIDGLYRGFGLAVELDGRHFHDPTKDMNRDNRHALEHGVTTLRYGWHAVTAEPCLVAAQVAQALKVRGWDGHVRRCPDCPVT